MHRPRPEVTRRFFNPNPVFNPMNTLTIIVTHTLNDGSLTDNSDETRIVTRGMACNRGDHRMKCQKRIGKRPNGD